MPGRDRSDVEDVADFFRHLADVLQVGALLAGNRLDRQRDVDQDAGNDERDDAEERVLGEQQRHARLARAGRERKAAPVRLIHQRGQVASQ